MPSRYSVFVLEVSQRTKTPNGDIMPKQVQASASRRLTYYFPPLVCFLFVSVVY